MHNGCTNRIDHGFFLMPILTIRIHKGFLLLIFMACPLNSSSLHVITLVIKDYKDPLAFQGKLLYISIYVINT